MGKKTLHIKSTLGALRKAGEFLRDCLIAFRVPVSQRPDLELATEEVLVNIIKYAYPDKEGDICMEIKKEEGAIRMEFVDAGPPFDPTRVTPPDFNLPLYEIPLGGLGVHLVKSLMDEVRYERKDGRNLLVLVKKIGKRRK